MKTRNLTTATARPIMGAALSLPFFKKTASVLFALLALLAARPARAATIESAGGGPWEVGATWVGGMVPGSGDDVVISHSVMLSSNVTVQSLTIGSGMACALETSGCILTCPTITNNRSLGGSGFTLVGTTTNNGTFIVNGGSCDVGTLINAPGGTVEWMDGILTTAGLTNNGILNIGTNNTVHQLSGPVTNNGTVNFTDGSLLNGTGGILTNNAFGTINLVAQNWSLDIVNNGAIVRSGTSITFFYGMNYSGSGSINIEADATLSLSTGLDATFDGEVIVDGFLEFFGCTNTIGVAANIHGNGRVIFTTGGSTFNGAPLELDVPVVDMSTQLTSSSTVKIQSGCHWNWYAGGEFLGPNPVENYGTVEMSGAFPEHFIAEDFENYGTFKWFGGDFEYTGGIDHFINKPGGVLHFDAQNATGWQVPITNEGDFVSDGSPATLPVALVNEMFSTFTIVDGGHLVVANTASITQNGESTVDGLLEFQGGIHYFNQTDAFSGAGEIRFTNDLTTITAPSGWAPAIATVTQQHNIDGSAAVTIGPTTEWFWEDGYTAFLSPMTNEGNLNISTNGTVSINMDFVNEGEIFYEKGIFNTLNTHSLENTATGTIHIIGDGFNKTSNIPISNNGLIEKTDDAQDMFSGNWVNELDGTINVTNGELYFGANNVLQYGDFTITTPGIVNLVGGYAKFFTNEGFTGTGELWLNALPTLDSDLGWSPGVAKVVQYSTITGTAVVTIPSGKIWEYQAGDMMQAGPLTVNGTLNILTNNSKSFAVDVVNNGTISWSDGFFDSPINQTLTNNASGHIVHDFAAGNCGMPIINHGTITMVTGNEFTAPFAMDDGLLAANGQTKIQQLTCSGGEMTGGEVYLNGPASLTGSLKVSSNGTLTFAASATMSALDLTLETGGHIGTLNTIDLEPMADGPQTGRSQRSGRPVGYITIESGVHVIAGTGAGGFNNLGYITKTGSGTSTIDVDFVNRGGTQIEGTLDVNSTYTLTGQFTGTGTLDLTNATLDSISPSGGYSPGNSPGTLNVIGNATLNSLNIEIEEGPPILFDKLVVSGTANIGGTLYLSETGNVPSGSWTIISAAAISGTFSSVNQPGCFEVEYTATSVILKKIGKLKTWDGAIDNWSNAAHWIPVGVPCPFDTVVIPSGQVSLDIQPQMAILTVTGGQVLNNSFDANINAPFIIAAGAQLDLAVTFTLYVNGTFCNAGKITGNGTIDILNASIAPGCFGTWSPGNSAGMLHVKGTHTNDIVEIEIGQNGGTEEVDYLDASQNIVVGGELRLSYLGGTVPAGDRVIMKCFGGTNCRTGVFNNITYQLPAGATGISIVYEPTLVRLVNDIPITFTGTATWLGGIGTWNDQSKWSSNDVPNDDDDVIVNSGNVVLTAAAATVKSLTMTGGTISGNKNLTVINAMQMGGGSQLNLAATTQVGGAMSLTGAASMANGSLVLNGGATIDQGSLTFAGGATMTIPAGKTLTVGGPTTGSFSQTGNLNLLLNYGILKKIGPSIFDINVPYTSNGTTHVFGGTLKFNSSFFTANGTVKGNGYLDVSGATVFPGGSYKPGDSPGTLHILGDYVNNANNLLEFEILENGGTITKDLLEISGAATLGGTLNIVHLGGNIPLGSYTILTSNGLPNQQFGTINYPAFCNGNCSIQYSPTGVNFVFAAALPVELLGFNAKLMDKSVELYWATASESNIDGFEIQRSNDGSVWSPIGWLPGTGSATERRDYVFADPAPQNGLNYYRLNIKSRNGASEFSGIVTVALPVASGWQVFPNPVGDELTVLFPEKKEGLLRLFNWAGKQVLSQKISSQKTVLDLSGLSAGVFWLKINDREGQLVVKH